MVTFYGYLQFLSMRKKRERERKRVSVNIFTSKDPNPFTLYLDVPWEFVTNLFSVCSLGDLDVDGHYVRSFRDEVVTQGSDPNKHRRPSRTQKVRGHRFHSLRVVRVSYGRGTSIRPLSSTRDGQVRPVYTPGAPDSCKRDLLQLW